MAGTGADGRADSQPFGPELKGSPGRRWLSLIGACRMLGSCRHGATRLHVQNGLAAGPGAADQLPVAVDVEAADHHRAVHRVLPHAGVDGLALQATFLGRPTLTDSSTGVTVMPAPEWRSRRG